MTELTFYLLGLCTLPSIVAVLLIWDDGFRREERNKTCHCGHRMPSNKKYGRKYPVETVAFIHRASKHKQIRF